MFKIIKNGAVR